MKAQTLHIRNMCCQRCIEAVTDELQSLGLKINSVKLGIANYKESDKVKLPEIETALKKRGFAVIKDEEEVLFEKIKSVTIELVHHLTEMEKTNFSFSLYLENNIEVPYRTLSKIFSSHHKLTIEKYFILLKIEKAKDLIENSSFQFSEIAYSMGYRSHQHLSAQFKKETGKTMHDYKLSGRKRRKMLDRI
jgi:AraC family transcriptional regulator